MICKKESEKEGDAQAMQTRDAAYTTVTPGNEVDEHVYATLPP